MIVDITNLKTGEKAIIKDIIGGAGIIRKVENMGIRIGKSVKKLSSHYLRGPQTIQIDRLNLAVGYGVAKKILVEVIR